MPRYGELIISLITCITVQPQNLDKSDVFRFFRLLRSNSMCCDLIHGMRWFMSAQRMNSNTCVLIAARKKGERAWRYRVQTILFCFKNNADWDTSLHNDKMWSIFGCHEWWSMEIIKMISSTLQMHQILAVQMLFFVVETTGSDMGNSSTLWYIFSLRD